LAEEKNKKNITLFLGGNRKASNYWQKQHLQNEQNILLVQFH